MALAKQTLAEAVALVEAHGGNVAAAARSVGMKYEKLYGRLKAARERGLAGDMDERRDAEAAQSRQADGFHVRGDAAEATRVSTERVRNLADLIRVCQIDTNEWEVERWVCNKWEMGAIPRAVGNKETGWSRDSTTPLVTELFQVKAWLKRKVVVIAARAEIASLLFDAKRVIRRPALTAPKLRRSGILLEVMIPDLHVGKLAWSKETGWMNYDSRIAVQTFEKALDALIERTRSHKIERVLFVVGNDLLHSDSKAGTTTAGTPLDNDSRFQKTFTLVRQMTTNAIDRLVTDVAPTRVITVPGNHDGLATWHLGDSLECFYRKQKHVEIDNDPTLRKYIQFGKSMIMFTHGNRGKLDRYPLLMATEQPDMFGATRWREAHTGDKHQLRVQEHNGVRVRIFPALCPPDAWHAEMTFVGNQRAAEAFAWDRDEGIVGTAIYTAPDDRDSDKAA